MTVWVVYGENMVVGVYASEQRAHEVVEQWRNEKHVYPSVEECTIEE